MKRKAAFWVPACLVFLLDQALKAYSAGQHRVLIPGIISLDYTLNTGFALGLFPDSALAATVLSAAVLVLMLVLLRAENWNTCSLIGFGLVIGGAAGNLLDRVLFSAVRDMLHLDFMHFYVFNLADAGVVVGVILILAVTLLDKRSDP